MTCREAERMVMPYINRELTLEEQEEFLDHVAQCEDCSDELEIYYTIQVGLEQLEKAPHSTYDIHKLMEEDIHSSRQKIYRSKVFGGIRLLISIVATVCIITAIVLQVLSWNEVEIQASGPKTEWERTYGQ